MQTDTQETTSTTVLSKSKYDLSRWRDAHRALVEEIQTNKRTMRAGYKGSHNLQTSDAEWRTAQAVSEQQAAAQATAHYLDRRATALYIFRASLRGHEHAPGLSEDTLKTIVHTACKWQTYKAGIGTGAKNQREAIIKMIGEEFEKK